MIKPVKRLTDCYERACKNIIGLSILQGNVTIKSNTILGSSESEYPNYPKTKVKSKLSKFDKR